MYGNMIRRFISATTANALTGQKFAVQNKPFLLSLFAASPTEGDSLGLSVGNQEVIVQGTRYNVQAASGVLDTDRDKLLDRVLCPAGEIFLPVTLTTDTDFMLWIEPIPG